MEARFEQPSGTGSGRLPSSLTGPAANLYNYSMTKSDLILLEAEPQLGETVEIAGPSLSALRAWSPRPGLAVTLTSLSGRAYRGRVVELGAQAARVLIFEDLRAPAESPLEIFLLQALPDKERMELIIEKTTELGVAVIAPWRAEKGIGLAERDGKQAKSVHWQRRALAAARQCRRGRVPTVLPCGDLAAALAAAGSCELKLVLWERAEALLGDALAGRAGLSRAAALIGPEGGLTAEEVETAAAAGFVAVSLGPRILRTETAAIVAVTLVQYLAGDLGGVRG
jgi:16S rRNA (uracil1498-N3)-methyltransferase